MLLTQYVFWIVILIIAVYLLWLIFRKIHGITGFSQLRGIFKVFRKLNTANTLLNLARQRCPDGDVSHYIARRENNLSNAAALAAALSYPALTVDPDADKDEAKVLLKKGFHAEAVKYLRNFKSMMERASNIATTAKIMMERAGETESDFVRELEGIKLP
jgi:hypothetical protein